MTENGSILENWDNWSLYYQGIFVNLGIFHRQKWHIQKKKIIFTINLRIRRQKRNINSIEKNFSL